MKRALLLSGLLAAALQACMVYDESLIEDQSQPIGTGGDGTGGVGNTGAMAGTGATSTGGVGSGGDAVGGTGGDTPTGGSGSGGEQSSGGTGGEATGGGGTGGGGTGGGGATLKLVDDLEHTDNAYVKNPFRGFWGAWSDTGGTLTKPVGATFTTDKGDGTRALQVSGSAFAANNGVDTYVTLNEAGSVQSVDVSSYTGITFFAKAASATKKIKVGIEDETSHPPGNQHPGSVRDLTTSWVRYYVPFDDIEFEAARSIVKTKAYALHFSMDPLAASDGAVDFWIDDVAFYTE